MQSNEMSQPTLEELYEKVILPQFGVMDDVSWDAHLVVGPDNEAHVFIHNKKRMALVFDDYPATDAKIIGLEFPFTTITGVKLDAGGDVMIDDSASSLEEIRDYTLRFGPSKTPFRYMYNVTGYFRLFRIDPVDSRR